MLYNSPKHHTRTTNHT